MLEWMGEYKGMRYVYRNDGLMVSFRTLPDRMTVIAKVHQVFIGGKKPTQLQGADDTSITTGFPEKR